MEHAVMLTELEAGWIKKVVQDADHKHSLGVNQFLKDITLQKMEKVLAAAKRDKEAAAKRE